MDGLVLYICYNNVKFLIKKLHSFVSFQYVSAVISQLSVIITETVADAASLPATSRFRDFAEMAMIEELAAT